MLIPGDTFTAEELGYFEDSATAAMTSEAVIERPTVAGNSLLGQTTTWVVIATLPCFLGKPTSPGEKVEGGALAGRMVWQIKFPLGSDVRSTDRATIAGQVFSITETDEGATDATALTAWAVRIR